VDLLEELQGFLVLARLKGLDPLLEALLEGGLALGRDTGGMGDQ
jgi:hypothetical protein